MTLKEYIEKLNKLATDNPEALELPVIYSKDDEGNGFQELTWDPSIGVAQDVEEYFIESFYSMGSEDLEDLEDPTPNAVCIN